MHNPDATLRPSQIMAGGIPFISWSGVATCVVGGVFYLVAWAKGSRARQIDKAKVVNHLSGALLRAGPCDMKSSTYISQIFLCWVTCCPCLWLSRGECTQTNHSSASCRIPAPQSPRWWRISSA